MALLGQGATGVPVDYSDWADSALLKARAIGGVADRVSNFVTDWADKQKANKDAIKTGKEQVKAFGVLFPEMKDKTDLLGAALDDGELPDSVKATFAKQIPAGVEMYLEQQAQRRNYALQDRQVTMQEQDQAFDQSIKGAEWQQRQDQQRDQDEFQALAAPAVLADVMQRAKASGGKIPFSEEQLQRILQEGTPGQKLQIAALAESYLPQPDKPVLRDIKFTNEAGQASEGTAQLVQGRNGPEWRIVPVQQAWGDGSGGQSLPGGVEDYLESSPVFRAPVTHYSKGGKHGPDELTDPWTEKGYSSTGKNLTEGMAAVNPKVHPIGTVFRDPKTGEVFIAGDKHGNRDPNVIDLYKDPANYTRSKAPRDLQIIGREAQVGRTPEAVQAQLDRYRGGVRAGAVTGGGQQKTPAELQKEQLEIQKLQGDVAAQKATQAEAVKTAKEGEAASGALGELMKKYAYLDGKTGQLTHNKRLDDAVGFGGGIGKQINRAIDGRTLADQQELERFVEKELLEATKSLKPVSNDEIKMLKSNRPALGDKPEAWAAYMQQIRQFIVSKGGKDPFGGAVKDAAYYRAALE